MSAAMDFSVDEVAERLRIRWRSVVAAAIRLGWIVKIGSDRFTTHAGRQSGYVVPVVELRGDPGRRVAVEVGQRFTEKALERLAREIIC